MVELGLGNHSSNQAIVHGTEHASRGFSRALGCRSIVVKLHLGILVHLAVASLVALLLLPFGLG